MSRDPVGSESSSGGLPSTRAELIAELTRRVAAHEADSGAGRVSHRAAIRRTAAETHLSPLCVKRLVDLYPEA